MPRPPRPTSLDIIFHVMARGNDGQAIFRDSADAQRFQTLLLEAKRRLSFRLYAHCLMPNHFHLLLHVLAAPLSSVMQWVQTCYAAYFNRRWTRRGHLFQGRFLSIHCQSDSYLLELLRYIHLNPVRGKLTQAPHEWPWSGHGELIGRQPPVLVDERFPLSLFHEDAGTARNLYADFVNAGIPGCHEMPDPFAEIQTSTQSPSSPKSPETIRGEERAGLLDIAETVVKESGVGLAALRNGGRARVLARARRLLIRQAIATGYRPCDISAFLGCSSTLISKSFKRS